MLGPSGLGLIEPHSPRLLHADGAATSKIGPISLLPSGVGHSRVTCASQDEGGTARAMRRARNIRSRCGSAFPPKREDGALRVRALDDPSVAPKLDSAIFVVKTVEDRLRCDDAEALNRARERGLFAQRAMNSRFVVISGIGFNTRRKWASPKTTMWSTHSRRIDPIIARQRRSATASLGRWACCGCPWLVIGA
jgi:hypothetical protein